MHLEQWRVWNLFLNEMLYESHSSIFHSIACRIHVFLIITMMKEYAYQLFLLAKLPRTYPFLKNNILSISQVFCLFERISIRPQYHINCLFDVTNFNNCVTTIIEIKCLISLSSSENTVYIIRENQSSNWIGFEVHSSNIR